jgi:hypothetical protein
MSAPSRCAPDWDVAMSMSPASLLCALAADELSSPGADDVGCISSGGVAAGTRVW